jgi:hypothetical protein
MISTNHYTANDKTILTAKEMWGEGRKKNLILRMGLFILAVHSL